jgi:hypothetical protein
MSFNSLMFLLDPAPPLRRVRGEDYAGLRRGYGPRYRRRRIADTGPAAPAVLHELLVSADVSWTGAHPHALPWAA